MPLVLEYRDATNIPVELTGVAPETVRERTVREIERLEISLGNDRLALAELFRVSGGAGDAVIRLVGDLAHVHDIGAGMSGGVLHVDGSAGRRLGRQMTGGAIHVAHDVGDGAGAQMSGGSIHIRGDAGHRVGAPILGGSRGMSGGAVLVEGNAGAEVGMAMRRGMIAVGGEAGDWLGRGMRAGTILVTGKCGDRPGAGMRRGTLILLGRPAPRLRPGFRYACRFSPPFLPLLCARLRSWNFPGWDDAAADLPFAFFHGDFLEGGRGEILLPAEN